MQIVYGGLWALANKYFEFLSTGVGVRCPADAGQTPLPQKPMAGTMWRYQSVG